MRFRIKPLWIVIATTAIAAVGAASIFAYRPPPDGVYAAEARAAMGRMMKAMHAAPSGDVDRDFAAMMIPHHQGAIDMALAQLRHGRNERLRRLAQGIVVEQQQEMAVMQAVLDEELGRPDVLAPTGALCRARLPL